MADGPFDGSPTYGVGSRTGVAPSISLIPVDHDPFAVTYVPVDHDPFNDSWAAASPGDRDAFGTLPQSEPVARTAPAGWWPQIKSLPGGVVQGQADPSSALGQAEAVGRFASRFGWGAPPSNQSQSLSGNLPWSHPPTVPDNINNEGDEYAVGGDRASQFPSLSNALFGAQQYTLRGLAASRPNPESANSTPFPFLQRTGLTSGDSDQFKPQAHWPNVASLDGSP